MDAVAGEVAVIAEVDGGVSAFFDGGGGGEGHEGGEGCDEGEGLHFGMIEKLSC